MMCVWAVKNRLFEIHVYSKAHCSWNGIRRVIHSLDQAVVDAIGARVVYFRVSAVVAGEYPCLLNTGIQTEAADVIRFADGKRIPERHVLYGEVTRVPDPQGVGFSFRAARLRFGNDAVARVGQRFPSSGYILSHIEHAVEVAGVFI